MRARATPVALAQARGRGSERGARALEVEREGRERRLADRDKARLAPLALHTQLLAVVIDVADSQQRRSPRRAVRTSRPARTAPGRAAPAGRSRESRRAGRVTSRVLSTRGSRTGRLGVAIRSAGFWAIRPCSRRLSNSARMAASLRARGSGRGPGVGEVGDVAAHPLGADVAGWRPCVSRPGRELTQIGAGRRDACAGRRRAGADPRSSSARACAHAGLSPSSAAGSADRIWSLPGSPAATLMTPRSSPSHASAPCLAGRALRAMRRRQAMESARRSHARAAHRVQTSRARTPRPPLRRRPSSTGGRSSRRRSRARAPP